MKHYDPDLDLIAARQVWVEFPDGPLSSEEWSQQTADSWSPAAESWVPGNSVTQALRDAWLWHWADSGYTTLRSSHSYAAALMATTAGPISAGTLLPWKALRAEIPGGLLVDPESGAEFRWCYLQLLSEGSALPEIAMAAGNGCCSLAISSLKAGGLYWDETAPIDRLHYRGRIGGDLNDVLHARSGELDWFDGTPMPMDEVKQRVMLLAVNYVSGLLYTLQHTHHWTASTHAHGTHASRGRRAPPNHRNVVVGRPIAVNLSQEVRALSRGESRQSCPAMFQSLVRGHYKRQFFGEARAHRKVIWVEPYWRGPEGAPLLARPYRFS